MSNLITLEQVSLAFGLNTLLDKVKLQVAEGERICLIGRNGAGKSSLLRIIEGIQLPDSGQVWRKPDVKIARLTQELPQQTHQTIYEFVAQGLSEMGKQLSAYHQLTIQLTHSSTQAELAKLENLQQIIDAKNGWQFEQKIKTILNRLELLPEQVVAELSGGWQRRAALAQALVSSPDLLLLDEPTNHLDIEAIQWLEDDLMNSRVGLLFITHDRALLKRLATRIVELDRGHLTSWPGDYVNFLRRKEEMLHAEAKQQNEFDKKLAEEEQWIRQGIKARRTRNEGRVRALEAMRDERSKRREQPVKASFNLNEAQRSGQLVIEAQNISHSYDDKCLISHFSIRIMRGDRIGLIGPNGVGKSTLLNLLLGKMNPQQGKIILGTKLEIAYFDQLRQTLDLEKTVIENVAEGTDLIEVDGKKKHIMSYLNDFLFTPQRALTPVKALSGGECNRLVLARLFKKPSNLLVLDEPTNDLDIETLELLEELLLQYRGTLLIVSHDRDFLDNVVTSTLVFEGKGKGKVTEYVGGYQDWLRQKKLSSTEVKIEKTAVQKIRMTKKLSYHEQKELAELPQKIEFFEKSIKELQNEINQADFYENQHEKVLSVLAKLSDLEAKLVKAYERWEELERGVE